MFIRPSGGKIFLDEGTVGDFLGWFCNLVVYLSLCCHAWCGALSWVKCRMCCVVFCVEYMCLAIWSTPATAEPAGSLAFKTVQIPRPSTPP